MQTYSQLIKTNGASPTQEALEQRARQLGLGVKRYRPNERFANTYGPYFLFNDRNRVEEYGFSSIEEVIDYFAEKRSAMNYEN